MGTRNVLITFTTFTAVAVLIAILNTGCNKAVSPPEDKSYLTPIPQETFGVYQLGQPVKTSQQAVLAVKNGGILTFHRNWIVQPVAVLAKSMTFKDALHQIGQATSYNGLARSQTQIWLVVFKGEWTYTLPAPGGTTAPLTGCVYVFIDAENGNWMGTGDVRSCESLNLDQ